MKGVKGKDGRREGWKEGRMEVEWVKKQREERKRMSELSFKNRIDYSAVTFMTATWQNRMQKSCHIQQLFLLTLYMFIYTHTHTYTHTQTSWLIRWRQ